MIIIIMKMGKSEIFHIWSRWSKGKSEIFHYTPGQHKSVETSTCYLRDFRVAKIGKIRHGRACEAASARIGPGRWSFMPKYRLPRRVFREFPFLATGNFIFTRLERAKSWVKIKFPVAKMGILEKLGGVIGILACAAAVCSRDRRQRACERGRRRSTWCKPRRRVENPEIAAF